MSDRWLGVLVPVVAREARANPRREWDDLLEEMVATCSRRGLRSILAELERDAEEPAG